ncbi:zinc ribbon domain-containing protein [Acetobacterium sp.]|uniref:zinc ribbon domain-containing protein n=1 Tax=Acetobacterium sp. TaxID=1872094 RepID=UPI00359386B1
MEVVVGISCLAVFIAIYWIIDSVFTKGINAASKVANKNILYRSEHKEGQDLVFQKLSYQTTVPIKVLMEEVSKEVLTAESPNSMKCVTYETSRSEDRITFAYGNALDPTLFEAVVAFSDHDGITECLFSITGWTEKNGIISEHQRSEIKKLKNRLQVVFERDDGSLVRNQEGNINNKKGKSSNSELQLCKNCSTELNGRSKYCPNCGVFIDLTDQRDSDCDTVVLCPDDTGCSNVKETQQRVCLECDSEINPTSKYCPNCGAPSVFPVENDWDDETVMLNQNDAELGESEKQPLRLCPVCTQEINLNAKFCPECGGRVTVQGEKKSVSKSAESMDEENSKDFSEAKKKRVFFQIIGAVLSLIGIVKFRFVGYYQSEAIFYVAVLLAGLVFFYLASKIKVQE